MKSPSSHKVKALIIPTVLILLVCCARLIPGPRTIDDAYITYRYARNILAGEGFTYNPGEFIQGTTTPLYTLLIALIGLFFGGPQAPFPQVALFINILSDALTVLMVWKLSVEISSPLAGVATAIVWAIAPFSVTFAIGGLETSFFVLTLTSAVYFYVTGKMRFSATLTSLCVLTRPDGLILAMLLVGHRLLDLIKNQPPEDSPSNEFKSKMLIEAALLIIPILVWFSFAWFYFGNPIPHSVLAKSQAYNLSPTAAFTRFLQHLATPFLGHHLFGRWWIAAGLVLYPFLTIVGSRSALEISKDLFPWILYPWLYVLTYSLANPLIFRWYLTPPLLPYIFFIFVGLEKITRRILNSLSKTQPWKIGDNWVKGIPSVILILPLFMTSLGWTLHPDHGLSRPAPKMSWYRIELTYREAADIVLEDLHANENLPDDPRLAAADVGVLGYFTGLEILDLVGLNSHQALSYYPLDDDAYVINYAVPTQLVLDESPGYLVLLEVYGRKTLLQSERFNDRYRILDRIDTDIYTSRGMLIYKRSDLW